MKYIYQQWNEQFIIKWNQNFNCATNTIKTNCRTYCVTILDIGINFYIVNNKYINLSSMVMFPLLWSYSVAGESVAAGGHRIVCYSTSFENICFSVSREF